MTDGKAIDIAERYGSFDTFDDQDTGCHVSKWVFSEHELCCFVQAVIEEDRNSETPNLHQFVSTFEELIDGKTQTRRPDPRLG